MLIGATLGGGIRLAKLNPLPVDGSTLAEPVEAPDAPDVSVEVGMPAVAVVPVPAAGAVTADWFA
jgi:hypothetical protein